MLRQAAAAAPDDAIIRARLRQALLARGVMAGVARAEARACFREASVIDPSDVRVWQALANLAHSRAEWLQALRDLLRAAPGHAQGRSTLRTALVADATALGAAGSAEAACELWREAIALTGGDVEVCLGLAAITLDPEEAERAIEQANDIDPQDERVVAAMERLRAPQIDPAAIELPDDAFERFGMPADGTDPAEGADAAAAPLETLLDELADLDRLAPPPAAVAAPAPVAPPAARGGGPRLRVERRVGRHRDDRRRQSDDPQDSGPLARTRRLQGHRRSGRRIGDRAAASTSCPISILLDIAMPKLDGYEVCKRIKQDPRTADVPVVMLSGKDAFFDKVKGRMAGATEYLTKPFETPAVLAVVAIFCQPTAEVVTWLKATSVDLTLPSLLQALSRERDRRRCCGCGAAPISTAVYFSRRRR